MMTKNITVVKWLIPLSILLLLSIFLWRSLYLKSRDDLLIHVHHKIPSFQLNTVEDITKKFDETAFYNKVSVLNIWASWCLYCAEEHDELLTLAKTMPEIQFIGVNFHDSYENANRFLKQRGNPYLHSLFDPEGRFAMDCGVTSVPEFFMIDKQGILRYRYRGPITQALWYTHIKPRLDQLLAEK